MSLKADTVNSSLPNEDTASGISRTIPSDIHYANKLKLKDVYHDIELFSHRTYNIEMMVKTKPIVMYLAAFLVGTGASLNLIRADRNKSRWITRM